MSENCKIKLSRKTPIISHRKTTDLTYKVFRLCGIWDYVSENPRAKIANFCIRSINWFISIFIQTAMMIDMLQNLKNIEAVGDIIGFLAPLSITTIKTIKLHTMQKRIQQLIESIHNPIEFLKYSSVWNIVNMCAVADVGVLTTIRTTMYYQNFELALFTVILGNVSVIIFSISSEASETGLAMRGKFPFNPNEPFAFKLVFLMQFWTIIISCVWVALFDLLILGLIRWINVQLQILQNNYRSCDPRTTKRDSYIMSDEIHAQVSNYNFFKVTEKQYTIKVFVPFKDDEVDVVDDSFILRLKTCIKHHKRILNYVKDFNDTFSVTFCIFVLTSNVVTCFYLYQAVWAIKNDKSIVKCVIMCFSVITELFYYCIYGTLLAAEEEALRLSQYSSAWPDHLNRTVLDLLLNALTISIKPIRIRAGYFFVFSVKTFVMILQKSYSFFAILNTMMN